jgi:hypothetical protein
VLGSIGVLKVAVMSLTAATLETPFVLFSGSLVPPFVGVVRITVGALQTLTIPGTSFLQPAITTMKNKAAVNPAVIGAPKNPRTVREKCVHVFAARDGFVV